MIEHGAEQLDAHVIRRFLSGEDRAYEELVQRYQRRIYNVALRFLRVPEEAEEVTQEIFVKVYKALKNFRGDAKFSTWLHMIALNHCKNRLKYLKRRHYFDNQSVDPPAGESDEAPVKQYVSANPGPAEQMQSAELQIVVRRAIDELIDEHRQVIILRDLQGFSYEEIAEITKQAVGTVKSRIHRARLELADKLRPLVETEGVT